MKDITIEQISGIVQEASKLMHHSGFEIHDKGSRENLVTSSDIAVQHFLTGRLAALLPGCGFLCEEENLNDLQHSDVWIIDPIDGTANYARGNENCAISVALVRGGILTAGVVYSPWRNELYTAEKDTGAFLNGEPIRVSNRAFEDAILFTAMSAYRKEFAKACNDIIFDTYMQSNDVRRFGSAAVELCLMASGQAELYFEMRLQPWDYAAAGLVLQEAGGAVCTLDGEFPSLRKASLVVAGNNRSNAGRLLKIVHKYLEKVPY